MESTQHILQELFRGTWYISAGLNPAFDVFDCQKHQFYPPSTRQKAFREIITTNEDSTLVADATFSYRIKMDGGKYFTKNGDKRLMLLEDGINDEKFSSQTSSLHDIKFQRGKRWGIDQFYLNADEHSNFDRKPDLQRKYRLVLTLRPPSLKYMDEWTILSYSNDPSYGYIVLAYQGTNAAWDGYGGLNIYTRTPFDLVSTSTTVDNSLLIDKQTPPIDDLQFMMRNIDIALGKVGLSLKDLSHVDNSCEN